MTDSQRNSNFMRQGAILAVSSILVRIIGLVYRIPLNNILGEKGVAYYGVAYDVYSILLLLSSYSLPLAVSKMISHHMALKEYKNARKILILSILFAIVVGFAAFCITYFGAGWFAKVLNYPQAAVALRVLSPALVILAVMGVLRGYFQGMHTMMPTAVSNIIEQIVNAAVSIIAAKVMFDSAQNYDAAAYGFSNVPEAYGAAGGTLGTVCGAGIALLFLVWIFVLSKKSQDARIRRDRTRNTETTGNIIKILVCTIIPVIISTTIYNLSGLIDSGLFSNIMDAKGMDKDLIDTYTGMFTGNYRLIVNVPIALASALASSLIPSVVHSRTEGNKKAVKYKVSSAIKLSMIVAMPCAVGIGVLAKPIINLLFPTSTDPDKVALMLMVGCISVVLYSLSTITNSILQGIDKMSLPVIHSAVSLLIHIAFLCGLLYIFNMDIFAVVVSDILFCLMVCIFNAHSLKKHLKFRQEKKKTFVMPAVCSVIMGFFTFFANKLIYALTHSIVVSVVFAIIISMIAYFLLLVKLRVVGENEMYSFPGGRKLAVICRKFHLL